MLRSISPASRKDGTRLRSRAVETSLGRADLGGVEAPSWCGAFWLRVAWVGGQELEAARSGSHESAAMVDMAVEFHGVEAEAERAVGEGT